jgi:hypothetical protein
MHDRSKWKGRVAVYEPPARLRMWAAALLVAAVLGVAGSAPAETNEERRLRLLEQQLQHQQQEIKQLRSELLQQKAVGQATESRAEEAAQNADKVKSGLDQAKKGFTIPDWVNKATVFGDVRYRHEGFYHQPAVHGQDVTARNRERVRARLGVRFVYSDELSATIRGASGNINDPISTNETLTGNFNRKSFNLDWAYLTFTPGKSFDLRPGVVSITAGKFPNPIFRADEMVFDEDIAAEGVSETFQLLAHPVGALDQVKLHALQWTFAEIANKQDGWMFGGQINPTAHLGNVQIEAGLGQYWWLNPDLIAQALSKNTTGFTAAGAPVANSSQKTQLANTNLLVVKTIQPPTFKGGKKPAAFTAITGYRSGFNQSNAVLSATIPNVVLAQPLRLWADYVYNWEAATDDAQGWTAGLRLGQVKNKGDWSLFGFYEHLGQEAAISSFTFSDFGTGGTGVQGPGIGIDYQLLNPLTISAKSYFTNFINRPASTSNPTLARTQLDLLLKF